MIDDNPLTAVNVQWLRSTVGLVHQQPILLPGTIHDNIAVGKTDATRAEVEEAAALANADQFIMALDDGCVTPTSAADSASFSIVLLISILYALHECESEMPSTVLRKSA